VVQSTEDGTAVVVKTYLFPYLLLYPLYPNNFALTSAKLISVNGFSPKKKVEFPASYNALCAAMISILSA